MIKFLFQINNLKRDILNISGTIDKLKLNLLKIIQSTESNSTHVSTKKLTNKQKETNPFFYTL